MLEVIREEVPGKGACMVMIVDGKLGFVPEASMVECLALAGVKADDEAGIVKCLERWNMRPATMAEFCDNGRWKITSVATTK